MLLIGLGLVAAACGSDDEAAFDGVPVGSATIVDEADVEFAEISPFATFGSAEGDFTSGPHSTFGIFGAGASSPPHTHSSSYYAVVLSGDMANPFGTETNPPTLTPGSFWAVPADDEHVTSCLTTQNGCRFFFHAAAAFDFTPIDEVVEARTAEASATPMQDFSFEQLDPYDGSAPLWGDPEAGRYGAMIRLDAGQDTGELAYRNAITLVPVIGQLSIDTDDENSAIGAGSLLEAEANTPHTLSCDDAVDCIFYLFSDGPLEISHN
jgi:mannose-6-phosphate isomerase-like protein (cupin superfamily)